MQLFLNRVMWLDHRKIGIFTLLYCFLSSFECKMINSLCSFSSQLNAMEKDFKVCALPQKG